MFKKTLMALCCLLTLTANAGQSSVTWQSPEKYVDILPSIENKHTFKDEVFKIFEAHFQKLATKLPEGQTLYINVSNLDLAGAVSFANSHKIRVVDDSTPPRMEFKFQVIDSNNKVLVSRGVYLWPKHFKFQRSLKVNKPYYHELDLITEWFENTFAPAIAKN